LQLAHHYGNSRTTWAQWISVRCHLTSLHQPIKAGTQFSHPRGM